MTVRKFLKTFNKKSFKDIYVRFSHIPEAYNYWTMDIVEDVDEVIEELMDHTDFEVELEVDSFEDYHNNVEVVVYLNITIHNL